LTTLQSVTYTRDAAGRALTRVVAPSAESWTYTYDKLNQLLSAANDRGRQQQLRLRRRRQHAHLRRAHATDGPDTIALL
jgi:YD repeat-containing protein